VKSRIPAAGAGLIAIAAFFFSAWVADHIYERLPHLEDDFANLWQAHVIARGHLALATPPEPNSFLVPFVVDYNGLRFTKYGRAVRACAEDRDAAALMGIPVDWVIAGRDGIFKAASVLTTSVAFIDPQSVSLDRRRPVPSFGSSKKEFLGHELLGLPLSKLLVQLP